MRDEKGRFLKGNKAPKTAFQKGGKLSEETKKKISEGCKRNGVGKWLMGRESSRKGKKYPAVSKENHRLWKGEDAGYIRKHSFVERHLGKPLKCEHCGVENLRDRQYHWANVDHKYSRNLSDYIRLCVKCHIKYDVENNGKKIQNKGIKYWGRNKIITP